MLESPRQVSECPRSLASSPLQLLLAFWLVVAALVLALMDVCT